MVFGEVNRIEMIPKIRNCLIIMNSLHTILISDIHCAKENITLISKWIESCQPPIDFIFLPGDFLNLPNKDPSTYQDGQEN